MARAATIHKDMPETAGRTRQSAAERRKAIVAAARDVFLERGYANSSIDAVVERSGGSKATVYQMFGNKEGLLAALVADGAEELAHLVEALPLDGGARRRVPGRANSRPVQLGIRSSRVMVRQGAGPRLSIRRTGPCRRPLPFGWRDIG